MASSFDGICSSLLLPITVPTRPQDRNTQYLEKWNGRKEQASATPVLFAAH